MAYDVQQDGKTYRVEGAGSMGEAQQAVSDHANNTYMMDAATNKEYGKIVMAFVLILVPMYYIPWFIRGYLGDCGISVSFWAVFFAVIIPLIILVIGGLILSIITQKSWLALSSLILGALICISGMVGYIDLITNGLFVYKRYLSLLMEPPYKNEITVTVPQTNMYYDIGENSKIAARLRPGENFRFLGASETGKILGFYEPQEDKVVWGWIDPKNTDGKASGKYDKLRPASVAAKTLEVRFRPRDGAKEIANIDNTWNVAAATSKSVDGYCPVFAWKSDASVEYVWVPASPYPRKVWNGHAFGWVKTDGLIIRE